MATVLHFVITTAMAVLLGTEDDAALLQDHCRRETDKLCKNVAGGWNGVYECLQQHQSKLSAECKQQLAATEQAHFDCHDDVARLCGDIFPMGGRVFECLRANEDELSDLCKAHVKAAFEAVEKASQACADDVSRFCRNVRPGTGRMAQCLKQNRSKLSNRCKAALGAEE